MLRFFITVVCCIFALNSIATAQLEFRRIATTDEIAPGFATPFTFLATRPIISRDGRVTFNAFISQAIYTEDDSDVLELVFLDGDAAPQAGPQATHLSFGSINVNNNRDYGFLGLVDNSTFPMSGNFAHWLSSNSDISPIAIEGAIPPGFSDSYEFGGDAGGDSEPPILNESGQMVVRWEVEKNGGLDHRGIWFQGGDELVLVAAEGEPVPNTPDGVFYNAVTGFPSLNNLGELVSRVTMGGNDIGTAEDGAIIGFRNGITGVIVKAGDPADFVLPGARFRNVFGASLNDAGQIAFRTVFDGPGFDSTNDSGIVVKQPFGPFSLIASEGELAPIPDANLTFFSFIDPRVNGRGDVTFVATLAGDGIGQSNNTAIFISIDGQLQLLAREGDPVPGTRTGQVLGNISTHALNNQGQVAFHTNVVAASGATGVFATDINFNLLSLAVADVPFDVDTSDLGEDLRIVEDCDLRTGSAGQDGRRTCISDDGDVVFILSFADGSEGIFVASTQACILGDVNLDGQVDLLDIAPFVQAIVSGEFDKQADINFDGVVDLLDIGPFVQLLIGN